MSVWEQFSLLSMGFFFWGYIQLLYRILFTYSISTWEKQSDGNYTKKNSMIKSNSKDSYFDSQKYLPVIAFIALVQKLFNNNCP